MKECDGVLAVVGAFARIKKGSGGEVTQRLNEMEGVEVFDLGEGDRIGLVVEAPHAKAAEEILGSVVDVADVWGVWPVSVELEEEPDRVVEEDSLFDVVP